MECTRLVILIFLGNFCFELEAKVFETRCHLLRELLKYKLFPRTYLSNWVCLIDKHSGRNTTAFVNKSDNKKYYGLFQIGGEWCRDGKKGGNCSMACEALLDENIVDDAVCAQKVFESKGFKYWSKWLSRCKGHTLPDIQRCPAWTDLSKTTFPKKYSKVIHQRGRRATKGRRTTDRVIKQ